ncbi:MAG: outer membrane beta-barrel protein [Chryseolinea sp.]
MKIRLSVITLLTLATLSVAAQTTKGTISFGGSLGFSSTREEDDSEDQRRSTFQFSPSVGFFVMDKLMIGAALGTSATKTDDGIGDDDVSRSFSFGPFARYYIFTSNEKFAFFAEAGTSFGGYRNEPDGGNETKGGFVNVYASPGFSFFPTPHWGIDLQFTALSFTGIDPNKDVDNDRYSTFNFGLNSITSSIGIRYFLSR